MSGKRNDVVDAGIVEVNRAWTFGSDYGELNALEAGLAWFVAKNLFHATKYELFGRTAFFRCTRLQAAIDGVRYIDSGSHKTILPYSWLERGYVYPIVGAKGYT